MLTIPKFLGRVGGRGGGIENKGKYYCPDQTRLCSGRQLTQKPQCVQRQKHSLTCTEGHAVAHFIGVLPIPETLQDLGDPGNFPHVVIYSPVPSALAVLILKGKLTTRAASSKRNLIVKKNATTDTVMPLPCERENTHHLPVTHHSFSLWNRPAISQGRSQKTHSTGSPPLVGEDRNFLHTRVKNEELGPNPTHCLFLQIKFY